MSDANPHSLTPAGFRTLTRLVFAAAILFALTGMFTGSAGAPLVPVSLAFTALGVLTRSTGNIVESYEYRLRALEARVAAQNSEGEVS